MRKSIYFIIQIVWSLLFSVVIWYLALKNANFDFYGNSDDTIMVVILVAGVTAFIGVFVAAYGSELLNKAF